MKAISIWQPWAYFMALGLKTVETRSWPTEYRGTLAIHAAKRRIDSIGLDLLCEFCPGKAFTEAINQLAYGAIIAVVELIECSGTHCFHDGKEGYVLSDAELALGDYTAGRFGWMTKNHRKLTPVKIRGYQGLWNLSPQEIQLIQSQLFSVNP